MYVYNVLNDLVINNILLCFILIHMYMLDKMFTGFKFSFSY